MKKLNAVLVAAALMGGAGLFAETFQFDKPDDWKIINGKITMVGENKNIMEIKGSTMLTSTREFTVDPTKVYELEAQAKLVSTVSAPCYLGFAVYDKEGRQMGAYTVNAGIGTESTLAREVKPGDKTILVKATPKWAKRNYQVVVWGAKKDLSDLPNFNFIGYVTAMQTAGENVEVTLKAPAKAAVPAGSSVRIHSEGGYMYTGGYCMPKNEDFTKIKGKAKGRAKVGMYGSAWAPGAVKARVIMLVNWGKYKETTQVKDVKLEIK